MADALGVTSVSVNRVLKMLEKHGLINRHRPRMQVPTGKDCVRWPTSTSDIYILTSADGSMSHSAQGSSRECCLIRA